MTMAENEENQPQSGGCLRPFLGWIVLLLAVAAVLFFCIVKPHLESRGVDVDSKIAEWENTAGKAADQALTGARQGVEAIKAKAPEVLDRARETFQTGREKTGDLVEKARDRAETVQEKAGTVREESAEWID